MYFVITLKVVEESKYKVLVYSRFFTNRLNYVLKHVFGTLMELDFETTRDKYFFQNSECIKINYSKEKIESSFQIVPVDLLFEKGVFQQNIVLQKWEELPCFFSTNGDIPFDIFASIFFLISRYEEYLSGKKDKHGRFDSLESLAYKNGFLQLPLVDLWAKKLREKITKNQKVGEVKRCFQFVSTVDVDHFYKYKGRGFLKNCVLLFRDLFVDFNQFKQRFLVVFGLKNDPWFCFDHIEKFHQKHHRNFTYFFHVGGRGLFDKRCKNPNAECYKRTILEQSKQNGVGLHTSYQAAFDEEKILQEKTNLQQWSGKEIKSNRFHFLRFFLPQSYQFLQNVGIFEDYSMVFVQQIGFRASTSIPFYFYDLCTECETLLKVVPTIVMDTTLETHLKLSPQDALGLVKELIDKVYLVKGVCVFIIHNELFSVEEDKCRWESFYDTIFEYISRLENNVLESDERL